MWLHATGGYQFIDKFRLIRTVGPFSGVDDRCCFLNATMFLVSTLFKSVIKISSFHMSSEREKKTKSIAQRIHNQLCYQKYDI